MGEGDPLVERTDNKRCAVCHHLGTVRYVTFPLANRRGTTVIDRSTAYLAYGLRAGRHAAAMAARGEIDIVHGFGASAPYKDLYRHFGITTEAIVAAATAALGKERGAPRKERA